MEIYFYAATQTPVQNSFIKYKQKKYILFEWKAQQESRAWMTSEICVFPRVPQCPAYGGKPSSLKPSNLRKKIFYNFNRIWQTAVKLNLILKKKLLWGVASVFLRDLRFELLEGCNFQVNKRQLRAIHRTNEGKTNQKYKERTDCGDCKLRGDFWASVQENFRVYEHHNFFQIWNIDWVNANKKEEERGN